MCKKGGSAWIIEGGEGKREGGGKQYGGPFPSSSLVSN